MEERSINRGEVWWVSVDDSIGGEQQTGRPALVVSTNGTSAINNAYTVAYITKGGFASPVMPAVIYGGVKHRVLCNQLRTLDGSRFTKRVTTVSNTDMARISGALASALGLQPPVKQEEVETPMVDDTDLQMELALYKRMYRKTLDQLVDLRIEMDMAKRMSVASEVIEEEPEVIEEEVVEEEPPAVEPEPLRIFRKEVELNSCTIDDLQSIGINEDTAIRLIEGRPYKKVEDVRTVDGVTSMLYSLLRQVAKVEPPVAAVVEVVETRREYTWEEFKKLPVSEQKEYLDYHRNELGEKESEIADGLSVKLATWYNYTSDRPVLRKTQIKREPTAKVVTPVEGVKVNINTATAKELMEKLGMAKDYAYAITRHRKMHGLFGDIEELLLVDRFSKNKYEEYKEHLTVTDVVAEEQPEEPEKPKSPVGEGITPAPVVKCNVNTASPFELQQAGFTKKQSFHIVHSRKNKGPFYDIDELSNVDGIKKKDIRKLRDVLEV